MVRYRDGPSETEEDHEELCKDIQSPGQDLNPEPQEYEAGLLTN